MLGISAAGLVLLVTLATPAFTQTAPFRIRPGITPPRLRKKVEPEFSLVARADHIQD